MQKLLRLQFSKLLMLLALLFGINSFGQSIYTNPITATNPSAANPYTAGSTTADNMTATGIGRSGPITAVSASDRYAGSGWNTAAINTANYFTFTLTPNTNYKINFVSFMYTGQSSGTGATSVAVRSSVDNFGANIGTATVSGTTISLAGTAYQNITTAITFRVYGWGASAVGGTFSINDFTFNGTVESTAPATASATTTAATLVTTTTATLNGSINTNGTGATAASFQYGTTTSYGTNITASPSSVTASGATLITAALSGLTPNTTYYFRAVGTQGTSPNTTVTNGSQQSFLTLAATPGAPVVNGETTTSLNVTIAANGNPDATTYAIQVGSQYVQANGSLGANAVWQTASVWGTKTITGLASSTQYTVGVKARNSALVETGFATATGTTLANTAPSITAGGTIAAMSTTYGTASSFSTFTVSSLNLTAPVTVTAPTGFEVSLSNAAGATYTSSVSVTANSTDIPVYVRLSATAPAASYNGSVVTLSSTGATTITKSIANATVSQKALTLSGLTGGTKVYDRTTTAPVSGVATLSATANGDVITVAGTPAFNFADANVGNTKTITVSGYTLAGTNAANYSLIQPTGLTGSITAKAVTIDNAAAQNKPYDGTQAAVVSGTVNGRISPDDVTLATTAQFAQATVGDNIAVTGFTLTGAQAGNYALTQPTVAANIAKGINDLAATAINLGLNATYALPGATVTSTSTGAYTYSLTASPAVTLNQNTLTTSATTVGTATLTITQAETANYLGKSIQIAVNVTTITYENGDFMTKTAGTWTNRATGTATWYKRVNGAWIDSATEPSGTADSYTVYITKNIEIPTATTQLATARIHVTENATLTFNSSTLWTFRNIYIDNGAAMQMNTRFTVLSSGTFEIADGGNFIYNYASNEGASTSVVTTLWAGIENFHPQSNFIIRNHDVGSGKYFLPVADTNITSNLYNGVNAYFGNLIVDSIDEVRLTTTNFNGKTLTHKNLEFTPNSAYVLIYGNLTWTIGGNLVISQPLGTTTARNVTVTSGANTVVLNVKGDVINNSKNTFRTASGSGTVTLNIDGSISLSDEGKFDINTSGTSIVNVKGDVSATANAVLFAGATATLNLNGAGNGLTDTTTQTIDIATTTTTKNQNINFNVKNGAYVKLLNRDFELGTNSKLTVENAGTLDFGFNGLTPLVVKASGVVTGTSFLSAANSNLKVTSENGVNGNAATTGNVQVATATYNANTNYYYVGATTPQVFGNAVTNAGVITIDKTNATDVVTASAAAANSIVVNKGILNAGTNVLGGATTNLTISANGKYRASGNGTKPDAGGTYALAAESTVEFYGADATNINTAPLYGKVLVTGSNVGTASASAGLGFVSGGAFEVTNGSTFKVANADGFNGSATTAITTTGTPAITLGATSTIQYTGTGAQNITAVNPLNTDDAIAGYGNLTIKSQGIATLGANLIYVRNDARVETAATLNVATGKTLRVKNQVINNGGTLTIKNNAALLQDNNVANTGNINVVKNSNPLYRLDYTLWSSPVSGTQTLANYSPETVSTRFYDYGFQNNGEYYINIPDGNATFTPAKGYLIRMPDIVATLPGYAQGRASHTFVGNFAGIPNNGEVTIAASTVANRYTAVGNPYPSPISIVDFFATNNQVVDAGSGIYLWRKRNGANTSSYATITLAGATFAYNPNPAGNGNSVNQGAFYSGDPSGWILSQGQGFFVRTKAGLTGTPQITFNNAMRRAAPINGDQAFFRTSPSEISRLWLNLNNADGSFAQSAIAYIDGATTDLDYGYDGKMFSGSNELSIYTLASETKLAIQARPLFNTTDVVPMGYSAAAAGQYTISVDHTDGVFNNGQNIYVRDNASGVIHNVSEGAYAFSTEAGTFNERFDVLYTADALGTTTPQLDANAVIVFKDGNTLNIDAGATMINAVTVYDIQGRKIVSKTGVNALQTAFTGLDIAQQVLVIEVNTVKGKVSKKIVY